ncbi:MAG: FMN-binding protein [Clostridia bacterium]|nr:FMN-binding protein [Clostridia bacterium]
MKNPLFGGALRLMVITLAAGLLLGGAYALTQPVVERRRAEWLEETLQAVCPGESYVLVTPPEISDKSVKIEAVYAVKPGGLVVLAATNGYGGELSLAIGLDDEGKVIAIRTQKHNETAGIGAKWLEDAGLSRFFNSAAGNIKLKEDVDAISGATVTGEAVTRAVNAAGEVFRLVVP